MSESLLIEGFFALDCGSRNDTLALINKVVGQLSPEAEIKGITVNTGDEAKELRFLGSPSIHINGEDIEPGSDKRDDYGLS
jgi:hypothetical protein